MSHYSELKQVLERMKKMGMKENQIAIMGDFLCAVVGMGVPEYQDVFPDVIKQFFQPEKKDEHITLFSDQTQEPNTALADKNSLSEPKRLLILDKNLNVKEEPYALLKAPPARVLENEFLTHKGDILVQESDLPKRTRECKRCHKILDISQFGRNNAMEDGLQKKCRQCFKEIRDSSEYDPSNEIPQKILALPLPSKFSEFDQWSAHRIATESGVEEKKLIPVLSAMVRRNILARTKLKEEHIFVYWKA